MKTLLIALFAQLKTVPALKWVDEDFGQLEVPEGRPPVQFPCALVTIDESNESLGGSEYDVTTTITVRVAHNRLGDRSANAPDDVVELTMKKLDDVEAVRDALEGFEVSGTCGRLYLRGITTERRNDGIAIKTLTFYETH